MRSVKLLCDLFLFLFLNDSFQSILGYLCEIYFPPFSIYFYWRFFKLRKRDLLGKTKNIFIIMGSNSNALRPREVSVSDGFKMQRSMLGLETNAEDKNKLFPLLS